MKGTQRWTVQLGFGDGNIENPRVKPAAIPETGGDRSFSKKQKTKKKSPTRTATVTRGVKARYFGARTGCQFGTSPALLTKRSRRLRIGKELAKHNSPERTRSQEERSVKTGCPSSDAWMSRARIAEPCVGTGWPEPPGYGPVVLQGFKVET